MTPVKWVYSFLKKYKWRMVLGLIMTTGIALDELPAGTQAEILNGKEIMNEEELYFFLESHSS